MSAVHSLIASADIADSPSHCRTCDGMGWVCENHPTAPWAGLSSHSEACECGAGAPCGSCNRAMLDHGCAHLSHSPKGICTGCREQHQPLPGYSSSELADLETAFWNDWNQS